MHLKFLRSGFSDIADEDPDKPMSIAEKLNIASTYRICFTDVIILMKAD